MVTVEVKTKQKFVLYNGTSGAHGFTYCQLLDVNHMAIVTYFFRGNPQLPHMLLFPICNKESFICTFTQTGEHIPQPLMDQLWTTVGGSGVVVVDVVVGGFF